jgi:GTP-binding protein
VEIQVLADIGLVGFPNAGKSSLLDRFTNARPKIAPYPFTTKIPNLGVLTIGDRDIILADIPGLIEGASEGAGLGIRFLKHISRTAALAFLIDLSQDNYLEAFTTLYKELEAFSPDLVQKPRILVGTKTDLEGTPERLEELKARHTGETVLGLSVFADQGLKELAAELGRLAAAGDPRGDAPAHGWGAAQAWGAASNQEWDPDQNRDPKPEDWEA